MLKYVSLLLFPPLIPVLPESCPLAYTTTVVSNLSPRFYSCLPKIYSPQSRRINLFKNIHCGADLLKPFSSYSWNKILTSDLALKYLHHMAPACLRDFILHSSPPSHW